MYRLALGAGVILTGLLAAALTNESAVYSWQLPAGIAPPEVPADNPMSSAKVALGRRLFYDADLSIDGTTSCGTCHEQHRAFTEGNPTHGGVGGVHGRRNVMGLANVAYFDPLTWADPTQHRLEAQVLVPLEGIHPVEMGMAGKRDELTKRLAEDPCYHTMFAVAFPETGGRIDVAAVAKALASFERTLLSFDAPFDRFKRGEEGALSPSAKRGAKLFFGTLGCASCHAGENFSDGKFHNIGLYSVDNRGSYPTTDHGLSETTGKALDQGAFRTPSLRNVALSSPYMHDGSVPVLADAIRRHLSSGGTTSPLRDSALEQAPLRELDLADVVFFLLSLTDSGFVNNLDLALPKNACGRAL